MYTNLVGIINRTDFLSRIEASFEVHSVVGLLGPRQCGKTTLARQFVEKYQIKSENYFDLEDAADLLRLENPKACLSLLSGFVIIDEIQRVPNLFTVLRVLVDRNNNPLRILVLGSASKELIKQSAETLAGRIGYLELTPFNLTEVKDLQNLWYRGGFPRSYFASTEEASYGWRSNYVMTFLERDIPNLGFDISTTTMHKFWMMLTAYHGNILNASELGKSMQLNYKTIQRYTYLLNETFMIRILHPWFENISKRQVKSPKIYFRDSGIFHNLLGIQNSASLLRNTKLGASWEGFALEEIIRYYKARKEECYFWATQSGAEIDLLIFKNGKKLGFEFKFSDVPKVTRSVLTALEVLKLDRVTIVYPGDKNFQFREKVFVVGLSDLRKRQKFL